MVVYGCSTLSLSGCRCGSSTADKQAVSAAQDQQLAGEGAVDAVEHAPTVSSSVKKGSNTLVSASGGFIPISERQVSGSKGFSWQAHVKTIRRTDFMMPSLPRVPSADARRPSRRGDDQNKVDQNTAGAPDSSADTHTSEQLFEQQVSFRVDPQGHFKIVKDMGNNYGLEAVFDGNYLYQKQRFSRFIPRDASAEEHQRLIRDVTGYWPSYWGIVGSYAKLEQVSGEPGASRSFRISLDSKTAAANPVGPDMTDSSPSATWRRLARMVTLSGTLAVDGTDNITSAALDFTYQLPAPKALDTQTGMASGLSQSGHVEISVSYSESIDTDQSAVVSIATPPSGTWINPQRRRTLLEEQFVMGEIDTPPDTPLDFKP